MELVGLELGRICANLAEKLDELGLIGRLLRHDDLCKAVPLAGLLDRRILHLDDDALAGGEK